MHRRRADWRPPVESDHAFAQPGAIVRLDGPRHQSREGPAAAEHLLAPVRARRAAAAAGPGSGSRSGKPNSRITGTRPRTFSGMSILRSMASGGESRPETAAWPRIVAGDDRHPADLVGLLRGEIPAYRRRVGGDPAVHLAVEGLDDLAPAADAIRRSWSPAGRPRRPAMAARCRFRPAPRRDWPHWAHRD